MDYQVFFCDKYHKASIFIIKESEFCNIFSWQDVLHSGEWAAAKYEPTIVPQLEVGYPFYIDLSLIEKHIIVKRGEKLIQQRLEYINQFRVHQEIKKKFLE